MEHVEVGGLRTSYRRSGAGPPLVLLHGAVCDGRVWRVQLDDLSDRFTVVALDLLGCGGSDDPPESFRLPEYAEHVAGVIGALGLERPHLVGHSWGSGLALELFRGHPQLPRSLVLAGGYAGWAGSLPPDEIERRLRLTLEIADRLPGGFDPTDVPGLFSDVMPADRAEELVAIMADIRPTATRVMALAFAEADLRDVLPTIDIPTLLLYGDADVRSSVDVGRELHRAIPGSTLTVMPGLGHEAFVEDSSTFDEHLREFLAGVP